MSIPPVSWMIASLHLAASIYMNFPNRPDFRHLATAPRGGIFSLVDSCEQKMLVLLEQLQKPLY